MIEVIYQKGLYLPELDLWLDPRSPKPRAFISHAHADHVARHSSTICSEVTARLLRDRFRISAERTDAHPFHSSFTDENFRITLLPAGHIAGSAMISVLVEVLIIAPPLVALLLWLGATGRGWFGRDLYYTALLPLAGPLSGGPLMLFSYGAQRVKLATSGLTQYLNPTLQFLSAWLILHEAVTIWHAVALALVWAAIASYSLGRR